MRDIINYQVEKEDQSEVTTNSIHQVIHALIMTLSSALLCIVLLGNNEAAALYGCGDYHGVACSAMEEEMEKVDKAVEAAKFLYNLATEQQAKAQDVFLSYHYKFTKEELPDGAGEQEHTNPAYFYRNNVAVNKKSAMEAAADFSMPEEPKEAVAQYKKRYFRNG